MSVTPVLLILLNIVSSLVDSGFVSWIVISNITESRAGGEPPRYDQSPFPVIDGIIQSQRVRCLISTASPISVIDPRAAKRCGLDLDNKDLNNVVENPNGTISVKDVQICIDNVTINIPTVFITDLTRHRTLIGQDIDVVLGNDSLNGVIVNFEPDRVWMTSELEAQGKEYDELKLSFLDDVPVIDVQVNGLGIRPFAIRTTSSVELTLTKATSDRLMESGRAAASRDSFSQKLDELHHTALVTCHEIKIGVSKFQNVPGYISDSNAIGASILKRMRLSIDFGRKIVFIRREAGGRTNWFPRNDSRIHLLFLTSSKLIVDRVISDIPAHGTDLQQNDEILLIEGRKPAELSLNDVLRYLSQSETPVPIVYSRNGKQHETMLSIPKTYEYPPKWEKSPEEKAREFFERME